MDLQPWRKEAKCKDLDTDKADELFSINVGERSNKAKAFCRNCPVRQECLAFALTYDEYGIWAGFTRNERKKILKTIGIPSATIGIESRLDLSQLLGIRSQRVVQVVVPLHQVPTLEEVLQELESLVLDPQDDFVTSLEPVVVLLEAL